MVDNSVLEDSLISAPSATAVPDLSSDPGVTIDLVSSPRLGVCGQCGKSVAISHVVRVDCGDGEFQQYDLCVRCASGDIDPVRLARLADQCAPLSNSDRASSDRIDRYWSHGQRAK